MTTMLQRLKRQAREGASGNGHLMKRYRSREFWGTPYAECARCGATVDVCANPAPNETNVSGEAVATFCRAEALSREESRHGGSGYRAENRHAWKYTDAAEEAA